jgi:alpha-tubulin suppressor-like RCC1 family protein
VRRVLPVALSALLAGGLLLAGQPVSAAPPPAVQAGETGSTFTSLSPVRVLDTRNTGGPVGAGGTVTVDLATHVPATTTAVVLNVTGVTPTAPTFVTVYPSGGARPVASSLNLTPGDIRPNQVTVTLSADRKVDLYNNSGNVHIVADIAGYYSTGAGAKFTALPASRLLDTREAGGPVGPGATRGLDLSAWIPASATAVTFNLTATNATASTFVTAWPAGTPLPTASNLNLPPGDTRPNLVTVAVGANRTVNLYNNGGTVDLIADLTGFYTPDYGAQFLPLSPTRVLDTRDGTGGTTGAVDAQRAITLELAARAPITSTAVVLNITGVDATASTYVSAYGMGQYTNASNLNLSPGQTVPNAAVVGLGSTRDILLYNNSGSVHLVADMAGAFAVLDAPACTTDCVLGWGRNGVERALGTGEAVTWTSVPTRAALTGVRAITGSMWGTQYALRADGTVVAWGRNDTGQLGNGWEAGNGGGSVVPVPVLGLTGVTAIASGQLTGYALREDGTVWAWGWNGTGQLGNGGFDNSSVAAPIPGLTDVVAIGSSWGTGYAVRADGTVLAWGVNAYGELGNGSIGGPSSVPVQVSGLTGVTAVAGDSGGDGVYALRGDGTVWAWGANYYGQLGNGQPCDPFGGELCSSRVPVQVSGLTGITAIDAGRYNGYALRGDGTVVAWGSSYRGVLGNGVECEEFSHACASAVPVPVSNLSDVTRIASFSHGAFALREDGTVAGWGHDIYETLANDQVFTHSAVPVPVQGLSGATAIAADYHTAWALVPNP